MAGVLILATVLALGAGAVVTVATASSRHGAHAAERVTQEALAAASRALIGRAAMDGDRPGSLPCPDTDDDGEADLWDRTGIHCPGYVGRLPWKTLGLPPLRDGSGELLWYALSPTLRDHPTMQPINSVEPSAQIRIVGTEPALDVAAVVIAPGAVLPGQVRNAAGARDPANYLEGHNATSGDNVYETALASAGFNDRVLAIGRAQLFDVVERRVANEIRTALQRYYAAFGFFPYANSYGDATLACTPALTRGRVPNADLSPLHPLAACPGHADWQPSMAPRIAPPAWFAANGWHLLTYYAVAPACTRPTLHCSGSGFLRLNDQSGVRAVVIVGSHAIASLGQARPCRAAEDCIEQPFAAANHYLANERSATFNDRVSFVP
jgi:hypothetical protein